MLNTEIHIQKISNLNIAIKLLKNAVKKLRDSPELFPFQIFYKNYSFCSKMDKQAYKNSFFILLSRTAQDF